MAPDGVEEADYESDPEELNRSLATRRREASDDEDENGGEIQSADIDSDEQSATVEFDNDADEGLHIQGDDSYDEEDEEEEEGDYGEVDDDNMEYKTTRVTGKAEPKGMEAGTEDSVVDGEEEPKQKEPFAVPTAGAFYMHDDRFQEMDAAPNRRMRGGRRLWPSRDERKWGHDKYDEMNTQEKQYDKRTSRGPARGRGQGRGHDRGYSRGSNYSKVFTNDGHQNQFPKAVTRGGRGHRRYEVALRNGTQAPSVQTKQSQNSFVEVSHVDSGRAPTETDSIETEARINVVASSLNSASPPFYPSGSSNNLAQKDLHADMGRLHVNGSPTPSGKKFGNAKSSSSWVRTTSQGRGAPPPGKVLNQGDNVISPMQIRGISKGTDESCQPPVSVTETGAFVAKGKGTLQPSGRGSFMYGGTQFMGPGEGMVAGHGNPNFPAFLPVMQFGGQHGGVPTFGVALPGYVQPEHGTGNPEMTWLPILTGPGALGASYPPPYAAIDGSYQVHKPVLPSSRQENSSNNPTDEEKSMERPDATNNGAPQRSNSNSNKQPRRYSEMSFSK